MTGSMKPEVDRALAFLKGKHDIPGNPVSATPSGFMYTIDWTLLTEEEVIEMAVFEGFDEASLK
jgi:hypothetical protein